MSEEERGSKRDIIVSKHIKNTHKPKAKWLTFYNCQLAKSWEFRFCVCVMACILYFICVRLRILGIFRNYTNFPAHGHSVRNDMFYWLWCGTFYVLFCFVFAVCFFFDAFCFVFSVDGGHQFPKGMQYRFKWQKAENSIKCICLHKHTI